MTEFEYILPILIIAGFCAAYVLIPIVLHFVATRVIKFIEYAVNPVRKKQ